MIILPSTGLHDWKIKYLVSCIVSFTVNIVLFLYLECHMILAILCTSFWFACSQRLQLFRFPIFWQWEYPMKVIPKKKKKTCVVCTKLMFTFYFVYIKYVESRINSQCTWVCELVHASNFLKYNPKCTRI